LKQIDLQEKDNIFFISFGVKFGYFSNNKRETPATIGVATLVPLSLT